jgi:uncharacterized protein
MLNRGNARKVTLYLNDDSSSSEGFIYEEVMGFLLEKEVAGATLIRPNEGFGSHHRLHEATRRSNPIRIEFVDSPEVVETLLPKLCEIVSDGLIEVHETVVVKAAVREAPV